MSPDTPPPEKPGQGAPTPGPTPGQKPSAPVARAKPAGPASPPRRRFIFTWLGFAWTVFALATVSALSTVMRFMFPNVLFEPKQIFKIGFPEDYKVGEVSLRWKEKFGIWVVRTHEDIYVLSTICTHLGCTPNWLASENKFKCPCHGSGFRKSGINFEGPAPRPLERFGVARSDDGQILVDKTRIYQQEKGQWEDPSSHLIV